MDVEVPEHVRVEGGEAATRPSTSAITISFSRSTTSPIQAESRGRRAHRGRTASSPRTRRGRSRRGPGRRSDAPDAASTPWSAILPARWDKSLNSPIRAAVRAEQDPERCRHRAPGTGTRWSRRCSSRPAPRTAWARSRPPRPCPTGTRTAAAPDVAGGLGVPPRVAGTQDQPRGHARRSRLPGGHAGVLRVVEGALFAVNGVNGVEVQTTRLWERAEALGLCRVVFVTMLDRERADFFVALEQLPSQLSDRRRRPDSDRARARARGDRRPLPHARVHGPERRARGEAGGDSRVRRRAGRRVPRAAR